MKKIDQSDYHKLISAFPTQLTEAISIASQYQFKPATEIHNVIICGMGGSGIGGKLVADLCATEIKVPITTHAGYALPKFANQHTLVLIVSYSGNTEETVSAFQEAQKRGSTIVSITSGGKIAQLDPTAIQIPAGLPPRQALAYLFVPQLMALHQMGLILDKTKDLKDTIRQIEKNQTAIQGRAKEIAKKAKNKIPIVLASTPLTSVGYRWTTQFNENAKVLCHYHVVPEHNHNEISSIPNTKNGFFILLHQKHEIPHITKRYEFLKQTIGKKTRYHEEILSGKTNLEDMLTAICLGDWSSYYASILYKRDPTKIPLVTNLRNYLAK